DPPLAFLRGFDAVADRAADRHLADARLAADPARAREDSRRDRGRRDAFGPTRGALATEWNLPRLAAWPPPGNRTAICVVLLAELAAQRRLLVPAHERADDGEERTRIRKQDQLPEEQRLADDDCPHGQVHRVTDVAVEPADHEALGRRDRGRRAR